MKGRPRPQQGSLPAVHGAVELAVDRQIGPTIRKLRSQLVLDVYFESGFHENSRPVPFVSTLMRRRTDKEIHPNANSPTDS